MAIKIDKLWHQCSQTNHQQVGAYDIKYGTICEGCGEKLASIEEVVTHIYEELTED